MDGDFLVGPWLVKPSLNSISCRNTTVRLEPKVMDVLICLAQHVGETLSKQTLLDTVWPGTFVTDDVLTHSISELRRAFGDDARKPLIIQTIPKRAIGSSPR
jgi:DNA-binding winged helix-turn-helix (wHTH) protein